MDKNYIISSMIKVSILSKELENIPYNVEGYSKIVSVALFFDPSAIRYVSPLSKDYLAIVSEGIRTNPFLIRYIDINSKYYDTFARIAVETNPESIIDISSKSSIYKELRSYALKKDAYINFNLGYQKENNLVQKKDVKVKKLSSFVSKKGK